MDAQLIKQVTDEFTEIEWFSKAGTVAEGSCAAVKIISVERDAQRYQKSEKRRYVTQEAQAWLTTTLSRDYREQDRDWNKVVAKGRAFHDKKIKPRLDEFGRGHRGWGMSLENAVLWDVLAAFAERYYVLLCLPRPMWFSQELEKIYRAGRVFCGYEYEGDIVKAFESHSGTFLCF
jgi:hypothetical protein